MSPIEDTAKESLASLLDCMDDPQTIAPLSNALLDHSSLIDASTSLPPMEDINDNSNPAVLTQASEAHMSPLTDVSPRKLSTTSVTPTQVLSISAVFPLELHVPLTIASPHDASFDR